MPSLMKKLALIIILSFATALAMALPAAADCSNVRFRFRFVDDTVDATPAQVTPDGCRITPNASGSITSSEIAVKPVHGAASAAGSGFVYRPKQGYHGPDSLQWKVCGTSMHGPGCSLVNFTFEVQ